MRKNLPDKQYFLGKQIQKYTIIDYEGSGNNAHVFRAYSDELKHDVAVKIIPISNLKGNWKEEFQKANVLRSRVVVKFWHFQEWNDEQHNIACIALLSDFVNGKNLREYVNANRKRISLSLVVDFLKEMFDLFNEMSDRGSQHGDLHWGNILVEENAGSLLGPEYSFRVTDFGVLPATSGANLKDDYEQLAFVLKELLENIDYQSADARERFIFNELNANFLARHLVESDTTRDPIARRPAKLFERLLSIESDFDKRQKEATIRHLTDPFEYLSCEQLGESHSLLKVLYSDRFLGLSDVERRDNLVMTGPRGCGKSTVFKSLALSHRILVEEDKPDQVKYVGVYYRCDDLYFAFPRYEHPARKDVIDIPLHFLSATLLSEILSLVYKWGTAYYPQEMVEKEELITKDLWTLLDLKRPEEPGADSFRSLASRLLKERKRAADKQRFLNDPKYSFGAYFGPDILIRACDSLSARLSFLNERPFYFFIDDYSAPKITIDLQQNLNRLVMQRTSSCFFKLSTESPVSYSRGDIDGKAYVERREYTLLNLGLVYITAGLKDKHRFIEDVFGRRLTAIPDYPVHDLESLIGTYIGPKFNEVARAIRDGKQIDIWGKEALCSLCSGDIHYIIDLVRQMVSNAGGRQVLSSIEFTPRITKEEQRRAIREQAGNFLKGLRILPKGSHLVEVVTAFGTVAHSYLKYRDSQNVEGRPPWQAHRIEPYEQLNLSDAAQDVYDQLLRYSVFIEDVRGKSRRGKVVPRLYLRRLLIPHFNLTFSARDSIPLEVGDVEELLLRPFDFEKSHRMRKHLNNGDQLVLPGIGSEE